MRNHSIRQNPDLMLVEFPQFFRHQLLLLEEPEHRRASVMAREVVRRSRKPRRPRPILHASTWSLPEIGKLAEPSRHNRTQGTVRRKTQKGIAWTQLTILVTAANDVSLLQGFLLYRKRHDVERVIGIH